MDVDMSPQAVTARLRRVSQLRDLCLSLARAKAVDEPGSHGARTPSPETLPARTPRAEAPETEPAA